MAENEAKELLIGKWSTDELDSEWGKCIHSFEFKKNGVLNGKVFFLAENESILSKGRYKFTGVNKLTLHIKEYFSADGSYIEKENRDMDILIDLNEDTLKVSHVRNGEEYLFKRME